MRFGCLGYLWLSWALPKCLALPCLALPCLSSGDGFTPPLPARCLGNRVRSPYCPGFSRKGGQTVAKGHERYAKRRREAPSKRQRDVKGHQMGAKRRPSGRQGEPKGCQSEPKGAPRRANLSPRWEPWATLGRPWGGMATIPKIIEKRARAPRFSGSKMDQILEPLASHFR